MVEFAITAQGLTKSFKDLVAVDDLDLKIKKGELFSLLGPNGAGKTTTIKMLSTLISPTRGDARLLGYDIKEQRESVRRVTNVSPQENAVAPHLSVRENLVLIGGSYGLERSVINRRCEEYMEMMNIADRAKSQAKTLSGGLQRRLSIAMALITDPEILFLDEPTLGLDPEARRELWKLILGLKGEKTILLTTHYLEEADQLSDRLSIMSGGRIIASGTPDEIKAQFEGKKELTLIGRDFPAEFKSALPYEISQVGERLTLSGAKIDVDRVIELIGLHGVSLEGISMKEPSLEDVYLHLIGKEGER